VVSRDTASFIIEQRPPTQAFQLTMVVINGERYDGPHGTEPLFEALATRIGQVGLFDRG